MFDAYDNLTARLRAAGDYAWPLALRLILAWEFWESGITKLRGSNWFADVPWADWQKGFPWPFSTLPTDLNWLAATWGEMIFAALLPLLAEGRVFAAVGALHLPGPEGLIAGLRQQGYELSPLSLPFSAAQGGSQAAQKGRHETADAP